MAEYTPHQRKYFAEQLSLRRPARDIEALASSMSGVKVDLNPHQVDAALFAIKSPLSNGCLLADEVGLGKTIEAGLVIAQLWAERKRAILLILPASLRIQWKTELEEKFNIPSLIIERPRSRKGAGAPANLFSLAVGQKKVAVCSYEYASKNKTAVGSILWDLVVIDEAHRLRNIYKTAGNVTSANIKEGIGKSKKLLLTATPLQNNLKELYGLVSIIDEHIFGDAAVFAQTNLDVLKSRLANIYRRTLRKTVRELGTINFTERKVLTRPFAPGEDEQLLYDMVTEYLDRPNLKALPENGRELIRIIIRKLMASSTEAIKGTLRKLAETLDSLKAGRENELEAKLAEDVESYDAYAEEFYGEDDFSEAGIQHDLALIDEERRMLGGMQKVADRIGRDAKSYELVEALNIAFSRASENKAAKKAVIFTESVRTQNYVLDVLNDAGYEGQIVLLNGTNSDAISRRIYADWKARHKNDGAATNSKSANMKAAIVEEFMTKAAILIGTESAAEGINLQFCSIVVNYDLPWNPQRVEQRIGRCHRYGQQYDVLVVNFVNQSNEADKRVYELLEKKFKLFDGLFSSSDEVLGDFARGIDFERACYEITEKFRTPEQVKEAFAELGKRFEEINEANRADAVRRMLAVLDEDVIARLKDCQDKTLASLGRFERWKYHLFMACGASRSGREGLSFEYNGVAYNPSWEGSKKDAANSFLQNDNPVYAELLSAAMELKPPRANIRFLNSSLHGSERFDAYQGARGAAIVDKLIYEYGKPGEKEEHLILTVACDSGFDMDEQLFGRLMQTPAEIAAGPPAAWPDELRGANIDKKLAEIESISKTSLVRRVLELDAWAEDCAEALQRQIDDLNAQKALKRGEMESNAAALTFQEILAIKDEMGKIDSEINRRQRTMFERKDAIRKNASSLSAEAEKQLQGRHRVENVLAFSFEIA